MKENKIFYRRLNDSLKNQKKLLIYSEADFACSIARNIKTAESINDMFDLVLYDNKTGAEIGGGALIETDSFIEYKTVPAAISPVKAAAPMQRSGPIAPHPFVPPSAQAVGR